MPYKKPLIGIIGGKGKMGSWFENFFISQGLPVIISDKDTELSNIELAKKADIVIVSVPISETTKVIKEIRNYLKNSTLLSDITSLKMKPTKEMKKAKCGVLGIHPLFGPLVQKLEGQKIVFCRVHDNQWVNFLKRIFIKNGAEILEMSAKEHDLQTAFLQALLHFTNLAFLKTIYRQKFLKDISFSTPLFRFQVILLGRLLNSDPKLLAEIEFENPFFKKVLKKFRKEINKLSSYVFKKDYENFIKEFKELTNYFGSYLEIAKLKSIEIQNIIDKEPKDLKNLKPKKISLKKKLKVGFLGPLGTFSHQASQVLFPQAKLIPLSEIKEIFEKICQGEIDIGVVPAENTISGLVSETINLLINYPLKVTGSFNLPIHHSLFSWSKSIENIKIIKTHPQAFLQCKNWLQKNLKEVSFESAPSTTSPILETLETKDQTIGFIANEIVAKKYGLNILAKNIEDIKDNFTKFYLISRDTDKEIIKKLKPRKTLFLLAVYDRVGVLRDILNVFAENNINLSALHSIPSRIRPWDYFFFIEAEIDLYSLTTKKIITDIKKYCTITRIIGTT